ncbi:putative TPR and ankyrin repeat-containing protein [Helianthus anomalus]
MHFVYIDEIQDFSMSEISLFKYICQNVIEGFLFTGDTAKTIGRSIDFRYEDARSLFYEDFKPLQEGEKGIVSKIFQLKRNFRTDAAVIALAQSVIELVYYYFPLTIDVLESETSSICGEAPILLEPDSDDNAIMTIFGGNEGDAGPGGFGAQ